MDNELIKKTIAITGFDSASYDGGGTKTVILSNKDKYFFYNKTKDGSITKAQEGYDKLRPRIGDTVEVMVSEIPDMFVNNQGKTINYTKRRIMAFNVSGAQMEVSQTPTARPMPTPVQTPSNSQLDRIEALLNDIAIAIGTRKTMGSPMVKTVQPHTPATTPAPVGTMGDGRDEEIPVIRTDEFESEITVDDIPF
jgi:hypothetical protein